MTLPSKRFSTTGVLAALAATLLSAPAADAQTSMAFDFTINLSAKAAKKLAAAGEGLTVSASYYGDPKKSAEKHANEVGQIELGVERFDLPGKPGMAHVSGKRVETARLKWISTPAMVNVNVFSGRKSSADNILSCDFIDNEVQVVTRQPITLNCALIEENVETQVKP